jgi:hypothetical protein
MTHVLRTFCFAASLAFGLLAASAFESWFASPVDVARPRITVYCFDASGGTISFDFESPGDALSFAALPVCRRAVARFSRSDNTITYWH